jgi:hypothetical protein
MIRPTVSGSSTARPYRKSWPSCPFWTCSCCRSDYSASALLVHLGFFRRQSGRAWWIYFLLTVIYSMYVLLDHDDFEHTATWKLLLPIAALTTRLLRAWIGRI